MTEPVKEISRTVEISSGGASHGGDSGHGHKKKQVPPNEKDLVEISQDARDRQSGRKMRNIIDYLKSFLS
jgi:hypothetical protein